MIHVDNKMYCCGCEACVQVCPRHCINFDSDSEGFSYPVVHVEKCIHCGLCENVCLYLNRKEERKSSKPLKVLACKHPNKNIQLHSSSGGIVSLIAEKVIEEGGVVFGAKFDKDWSVIHEFTETLAGLTAFRGSKYVQSRIGSSFLLVKEFLEKSRLVLFIGTPCQVRALYLFLRQRYSNLLTIDLVCHGIGSPKVWRLYLEQYYSKDIIRSIAHRDKTLGWERYCLRVSYLHHGKKLVRCEDLRKNPYLRGFIHNIFLRPSCSNCPSKGFKSGSDFTCADFWGIKTIAPNIYDKNGVSLLMVNNERAELFFNKLNISSFPMDYGSAYKYNPSIIASAPIHHFRHLFFLMLGKINFKALVFLIQGINKLHRMMFKAKKV